MTDRSRGPRRRRRRRRPVGRPRARPGRRVDAASSRSSIPPAPTPAPPRAASAPPSGTSRRTTGSGTCSTRSRAATTSSTRTPPRSWRGRRSRPSSSSSTWACRSTGRPTGKIDQRRFGGHTRNFGEGPVKRACFAADRTGHMILQTLYQNCIKAGVRFYDEYHVVDLLFEGGDGGDGGRAAGVVGYRIADGELHTFRAKAVLLATGGNGRMFRITSNAHSLTGDGMALAYRHGIPLEDMEFYQFHPTGLYGLGILLSEAARGEGGYLLNKDGERFMSRYAPNAHGAGAARHGEPGDLPRGQGRPGGRPQGRLRAPGRAPPGAQGHRGEAPRHHRLRPRLPRRRAAHRAGPDPAHGPLRDGRRPDRPPDPGDPRRAQHRGRGPLRRRRGRLRLRPRGEPPRHELAGRPARVRPAGRARDGRLLRRDRHAGRRRATRTRRSARRSRRSAAGPRARAPSSSRPSWPP